ncbi:MAG: hypothetical protein AAF217_00645 [Pseudomonadota bacterium]
MARFDFSAVEHTGFASSNSVDHLFELGLAYATGRDGEKDVIAAHKWFNIAAFRGYELAKARREEIALEMTRNQIAKAQRAAREWITQH